MGPGVASNPQPAGTQHHRSVRTLKLEVWGPQNSLRQSWHRAASCLQGLPPPGDRPHGSGQGGPQAAATPPWEKVQARPCPFVLPYENTPSSYNRKVRDRTIENPTRKLLPNLAHRENTTWFSFNFSSVQLLIRVWLFATPWTTAHQTSLSITNSQSLLKLMSIKSVMPSNHLILCHPLLLPPSIFSSMRVFSNESVLCIMWPKDYSFSFSISPQNKKLISWPEMSPSNHHFL